MIKKRIPTFLAGFLSAVLMLGLCTTALAAAGKITYNFANIALRGERKIEAGTMVMAQNGQQVPSSILYIDEAGGKTNYLPIRAISDLLGVEIDYDSETKTVHLDGKGLELRDGWHWSQKTYGNRVAYEATGNAQEFEQAPSWQPTELPDGWGVKSIASTGIKNKTCVWHFQNGEDTLSFKCNYFGNTTVDVELNTSKNAADVWKQAQVNGVNADYYQMDDAGLLVWETADRSLCRLEGSLTKTELETIAASVVKSTAQSLPNYVADWLPAGSEQTGESRLQGAVNFNWRDENGTVFNLLYSIMPVAEPSGTPETVKVQGGVGRFWPGDPKNSGASITVGSAQSGIKIPGTTGYSTLIWMDTETGITFRLQAVMEKDAMIRIAQNMRLL